MQNHSQLLTELKDHKGAAAIIVGLLIIVFMGFAAFAIDIGYTLVARNELQNAADAAALAGARRMGQNYHEGLDPVTDVTSVAQNTASQNKAAGLNLAEDISAGNVVTLIGTWDPTKPPDERFATTSVYPNAVQVVAKREGGTKNGPIGTFFAPIFKLLNPSSPDTVNVGATACAALTGPCKAKPGIPLGIGRGWFDTHHGDEACGPAIEMNDTTTSCAGWSNLSDEDFKQEQVQVLLTPGAAMPTITGGDQVQFGGGTVTPLLTALKTLFDNMKGVNDSELDEDDDPNTNSLDKDEDPNTWTTSVVVYDAPCSRNPNALYKILGFATLTITEVIPTGTDKGIKAKVACHMTEETRGGCFNAGTLGTIPNLVQ